MHQKHKINKLVLGKKTQKNLNI